MVSGPRDPARPACNRMFFRGASSRRPWPCTTPRGRTRTWGSLWGKIYALMGRSFWEATNLSLFAGIVITLAFFSISQHNNNFPKLNISLQNALVSGNFLRFRAIPAKLLTFGEKWQIHFCKIAIKFSRHPEKSKWWTVQTCANIADLKKTGK